MPLVQENNKPDRVIRPHRFFILAFGAVLLSCLVLVPHPAHAEGKVTDCSKYGPGAGTLQTAMKGGGLVTFECSGVIIVPEMQLGLTNLILDATGQHVTLDGNHANRLFDVGDGNLEIRYLTLTGGKSVEGGGAIFSGGQVTITHSLIYGNEATYGGALEIYNGRLLIVSSTITDNYANSPGSTGGGGAIDQYYQYWAGLDVRSKSSLVATGRDRIKPGDETKVVPASDSSPVPEVTILFSTITNNRAEISTRAGLWRENGNLTLEGTIIAKNDGRDCLIEGTASFNPKNANLDGDGSCSASIHADPLLTALTDYGGPTLLFGLKSNSPAIDAAPPGPCLAPTDQRRVQRPRDGTRDQVAACDLGAYEFAKYFYGNANLNDGLVGHWRFDEGAGAVALDSSGFGNNGVLGPALEYGTDVAPVGFNDLYSLSSTRSGMVTTPNAAVLNPHSSMTLAAWVRLNRTGGDVRLIDKVGNLTTGPGYLFAAENGVLRADFWDAADARHTITAGLVVTGTWIHVAVTWSAGGVATTYVNGVAAGSQPGGASLKASNGPLRISANGQIDDVRIYDRELSAAQVGALAGGSSCVQTGTTWDDAVPDLQCALTAMNSGNSLWVAKGRYVPFRGPDPEVSFVIPSGAAVYGGFPSGATNMNQRDLANNPSVLSGDLMGDDQSDSTGVVTDVTAIVGNNARHVVVLSDAVDQTVLDGFIVTAGATQSSQETVEYDATNSLLGSGAGIYIVSGSPLLRRLLVVGNWASYQGRRVHHGRRAALGGCGDAQQPGRPRWGHRHGKWCVDHCKRLDRGQLFGQHGRRHLARIGRVSAGERNDGRQPCAHCRWRRRHGELCV
ncbi:MAG: hypothetical protein IPK16_15300 [Anaerolineales bacterium]|nr:hypothetical protein [Anaerolineales bacterium]